MKKIIAAILFGLFVLPSAFAQTNSDEKEAWKVIDTLFAEMANHNPPAIAKLFTAESNLTALIKNKEGKTVLKVFTGETFSKNFAENHGPLQEDMYAPEVKVFGDLAMVWGRYVFFANGKISHCGVNSFHLARTDSGWKIVNASSTIDPQSCTEQEKSRKPTAK